MDHSLIVRFDSRCIVQDDDFRFEIVDWVRFGVLVDEDHTLPEVVPLELLLLHLRLDGEADGLASRCNLDSHSLVVDALDFNGTELTLLVGSEEQGLAWLDCTGEKSSSNNDTDTRYLVESIYEELDWIGR